jgi:hypothetical protein|tara:strand:- start:14 stop:307 length:294 start_codon:yes stop_codon:yes gene_type:complete
MKSLLVAMAPSMVAASDAITKFDWGTVSATGLLGWYLWYTTKVVMPRHQEQITTMQDKCAEELRSQRDHYETLLEEQQTQHATRHKEILDALKRIAE